MADIDTHSPETNYATRSNIVVPDPRDAERVRDVATVQLLDDSFVAEPLEVPDGDDVTLQEIIDANTERIADTDLSVVVDASDKHYIEQRDGVEIDAPVTNPPVAPVDPATFVSDDTATVEASDDVEAGPQPSFAGTPGSDTKAPEPTETSTPVVEPSQGDEAPAPAEQPSDNDTSNDPDPTSAVPAASDDADEDKADAPPTVVEDDLDHSNTGGGFG